MTKNKLTLTFGLLSFLLLASFVDDPYFPALPKIKTVKEWKEWATTSKFHKSNSEKWLVSRRDYYPNGHLHQLLGVEPNGDTTILKVYNLNNDSTLKESVWYNKYLRKWINGDTYHYKEGEKSSYMTKDEHGYKSYYTNNNKGELIKLLLKNDKNESFSEYEYVYDSTGLMIQKIESDFFGDQKGVVGKYVFKYKKDSKGNVIKKEYLVPHSKEKSVTQTDAQGYQKITYYGRSSKKTLLIETIYFNNKGERIKKIQYDRKNKPSLVWTYDYDYYKGKN